MTEYATYENILSQYLYGSLDAPTRPEDRLRDWTGIPAQNQNTYLNVDTTSYMETVGRFAKFSDVPIVKDFFSGALSAQGVTGSDQVTRFSIEDLRDSLGRLPDSCEVVVSHYTADPTSDDYALRAFVWGTTQFAISGQTTLCWGPDGTKWLESASFRPFNDNFDFESTSGLAAFVNPTLKALVDPYEIGRRVDLRFSEASKEAYEATHLGDIYTEAMFNASAPSDYVLVNNLLTETQKDHAEYFVAEAASFWGQFVVGAAIGAAKLYSELNATGLIDYTAIDRDLIYGSDGDDVLGYGNHSGLLTGADPAQNGAYIVGGSGQDAINGGDKSDILHGGDGNDRITTGLNGAWFDEVVAGDGNDLIIVASGSTGSVVHGGDGDDTILIGSTGIHSFDGGLGADTVSFRTSQLNTYIELYNADSSDKIVWNGHVLTGGQTYVFDKEIEDDGNGNETEHYWIGWGDQYGAKYLKGTASGGTGDETDPYFEYQTLTVQLPDGTGFMIHDYQDGDYGLSLSGADPDEVAGWEDKSGVPTYSNAMDEIHQEFDGNLGSEQAIAAITVAGSYVDPFGFLP